MSPNNFASVLTASPKHSMAEVIVIRLREAIASGKLAPGERLQEQAIAETLGVSRGPVREALVLLEREGLVVRNHNKGAFVARLSQEDLDEVFSLRLALERLAVQRAVRYATPQLFADLEVVLEQMARLVERGITEQELADLDLRFHDFIYAASRHQRLLDAWKNLRPQIHIFLLSRNVANLDFRETIVSSHKIVVEALRDGDEAAAITKIEVHLHEAYHRITAEYKPQRQSPG